MAKPIPILFSIPNFMTAGSGNAMLNIVRNLDQSQYSPVICVFKKGGRLYQEAESLGVEVIEAPFAISVKPYATFLLRAWEASKNFRSYKFKLWHSFHYLDDYTEPVIARMAGVRKWIYTKKNMSWGSESWKLRTTFASGIAAQNSAMPDLFFSSMKKKIEIIPPGVDLDQYYPVDQKRALKQQLGISSTDILVGHSAHFVPVKNHPHLISALAGCRMKNIHLAFAGRMGESTYILEVRKLVNELGLEKRVHFLGEIDHIPDFLNSLDLFAFCSHQEACPVAVLEAMACGLPCVVTDILGIRDMHIHRKTGLIIPPSDLIGFSSALDELAGSKSLRQVFGKQASLRIRQNFSVDREVRQYLEFYERLLN